MYNFKDEKVFNREYSYRNVTTDSKVSVICSNRIDLKSFTPSVILKF